MNAWGYLLVAIGLEVTGTVLLKHSEGFIRLQWGFLSILCYALCFWALAYALRVLPVGVAYAIWAGVGIIGASAFGILFFGDRLSLVQYGSIGLIMIGAVGLKLTTHI